MNPPKHVTGPSEWQGKVMEGASQNGLDRGIGEAKLELGIRPYTGENFTDVLVTGSNGNALVQREHGQNSPYVSYSRNADSDSGIQTDRVEVSSFGAEGETSSSQLSIAQHDTGVTAYAYKESNTTQNGGESGVTVVSTDSNNDGAPDAIVSQNAGESGEMLYTDTDKDGLVDSGPAEGEFIVNHLPQGYYDLLNRRGEMSGKLDEALATLPPPDTN